MTVDTGDWVILVARISLAVLFLIFGWRKLNEYSGTMRQMMTDNLPLPAVAAATAIVMELPVASAVAVGAKEVP